MLGVPATKVKSGATTVTLAVLLETPVPPFVEVIVLPPFTTVLKFPAVAPVTVTPKTHWLFAATVAPVSTMVDGAIV